MELLDMSHYGHIGVSFSQAINRGKVFESAARTKICRSNMMATDMNVTLQMALLTNGFGQFARKSAWIHDGIVWFRCC